MASNYTEHLGLTLWDAQDSVLRTEFNENNRKIDAGILELSPKFYAGSYVGTGTYGAENPVRLQLPFVPKLILLTSFGNGDSTYSDCLAVMIANQPTALLLLSHHYTVSYVLFQQLNVTWSGTQVSWYGTKIGQFHEEEEANYSANHSGCTYNYIAIG